MRLYCVALLFYVAVSSINHYLHYLVDLSIIKNTKQKYKYNMWLIEMMEYRRG